MNTASALGTDGQARWSLRLLGGFELSAIPGGEKLTGLGKRERVLLAYLALNPKGKELRRKLTTLLWGDSADETTLENLRNCLYGLRKSLGDSDRTVLLSEGEELVLDAAAFEIDVLTFRGLAAQTDRAELEQAAKVYTGGLLEGLDIESEEFESWRRIEAARLKDQAADVLGRLMAQQSDAGETERAIATGQRLLALDPLHEGAVRRLMKLHAGSGRRSAAIQLYRTLSDALKADLGAQPEAETRALFDEITRGDEQPAAPAATPAVAASPVPSAARASDAILSAAPLPAPAIVTPRQWWMVRPIWILTGGLAATAMIAAVLLYQSVSSSGTTTAQQPGASLSPASAIAVVVLPFTNLSGDASQEFFSDGVTEEIRSALAMISDLGVVARTSSDQYRDQNRNIQEIAKALNATHLIEGTVRKDGDQVRIAARLIRGDNGLQVWTDSYDRRLTDIFAIQEEIATAIAAALQIRLQPGQRLLSSRDIDSQSYEQYLSARAVIRSRVNQPGAAERRLEAIGMLEQVVARHPGYAPAQATLSLGYLRRGVILPGGATLEERRRSVDEWLPKAEAAARRTIELDPNLPDGYSQLGVTILRSGDLLQMEELYSKALALDPFHPETMHFYAILLGGVGRVKEAIAMRQRLRRIDPLVGVYGSNYEEMLWVDGQTDKALAGPSGVSPVMLARIYWAEGRYPEAADALMKLPPERTSEAQAAARLLRSAPGTAISIQSLPRFDIGLDGLDFVYLHVGAPELVVQGYEDSIAAGPPNLVGLVLLWHPSYAAARKTERFKAFARNAGLVDYWRAKGWPEFCRPAGTDDFTCS